MTLPSRGPTSTATAGATPWRSREGTLEGAPNDAYGQYLCATTPFHIWSYTIYAESCELLPTGRWRATFPVPVDFCSDP
ncbi:MAG: hypothetical protein QM820_39060 [Minicystis sp.]